MSILSSSKTFYSNLIIIFSIFTLDRLTKIYVIYLDKINSGSEIFSSKFLNIYLIWNEGIAFGLFAFNENFYYNSFTGIIVIVSLIVFFFMMKSKGIEKYCFMVIFGGSLGNIFDRLYYSAVPDFIDFHYQNFHWFIFNVADIFITTGVIILIVLEIFKKYDKEY